MYRYFWDTVPRFQYLTNLSEACAVNDTDRPHVLAYEQSTFLCAASSCCRQRWQVMKNMSGDVAVQLEFQTSWRVHLGACFRDVPSCCWWWNAKLTVAYTTYNFISRLQTTLSAAKLGSELSAISFFSLPSASATVFVASHFQ